MDCVQQIGIFHANLIPSHSKIKGIPEWMRKGATMLSARKGQGLVEYALILVLVALIVIVILAIFGPGIGNMYSNVIHNI